MRAGQAQQAKSRHQILRAAMKLMSAQGCEATTLKEIAREAGVGDVTRYNCFASQERLLLGYLEAAVQGAIAQWRATPDEATFTLRERLQLLVDALLAPLAPDRAFVSIARRVLHSTPLLVVDAGLPGRAAQPRLSPLEQFLRAAPATPAWVQACMRLRNRMVQPFGLKNLGDLAALTPQRTAGSYRVGDRVGIFTLFEQHPDELLLGDRDRHLDVTLSVHQARDVVTLTTVVHIHGLLGPLYMLPVAPTHHLIAPAVLRTVGQPDSP